MRHESYKFAKTPRLTCQDDRDTCPPKLDTFNAKIDMEQILNIRIQKDLACHPAVLSALQYLELCVKQAEYEKARAVGGSSQAISQESHVERKTSHASDEYHAHLRDIIDRIRKNIKGRAKVEAVECPIFRVAETGKRDTNVNDNNKKNETGKKIAHEIINIINIIVNIIIGGAERNVRQRST